jgi:hypothetical protein
MPGPRLIRSRFSFALVCTACLIAAPTFGAGALSLRFEAGQLVGLRVGDGSLPSRGVGGFYVQRYRVVTGPDLLREHGLSGLPRPLPQAFAIDPKTTWQGKPTLTIKLPENRPTDSGELELHVDSVQPHHVYLLRFAHRGERLSGEFPPILHIRQYDQAGQSVTPQLNLDLLNGTYDWKEELVAVPAVEGAARFGLMLHHPKGMGQFWISEIALQETTPQPVVPVPGMWSDEAEPQFTGSIPGTPITVQARATSLLRVTSIRTTLSAPSDWLRRHSAAMVLSFRLPLAATGWRWGDYLRRERRIEAGQTYSYYHLIGRRQFREVSAFPMAAIAGPQHGIAFMAPLKPTLLSRFRYDADGYLCAEFDLGMADRDQGPTEEVSFSFDIQRFEPRWGWRSALAAYYTRYPDLFVSDAKEGGWWDGPSEKFERLEDFGLRYGEAHFASPESAQANGRMGLYTCSYSEPWMWRIAVGEENNLALARPFSSYLPAIERDANSPETAMGSHDYWTAPRRDSARAFLNSAIFGPNGKYQENAARTYTGTFIEMNTSCLPGIRSRRWGDMNRGLLSYRYETLEDAKRCAAGGAKVDGVYFDSVGDWSDIAAEDHRAEHFPFSSYPLTFSYATAKPVISGLAAMAEYMEFIRQKGYVTMANSDSTYAAYAAPYLDMIGAGENFADEAASDPALSHDRAIAYRKSVSFGNSGMLAAASEEAEARFRLLLFYHVYPGIFPSDTESLARIRPLYKRYIPLMQEMGRAGWQPVPWAAPGEPELWVERYGPAVGGQSALVYFAVRNPSDRPIATTLAIEPLQFGRSIVAGVAATNAVTGRSMPVQRSVDKLLVSVTVPERDTLVVKVAWPR